MDCSFIEGDRLFNIVFGTITGSVCLSLAVPMLWWVLPKHEKWFFTQRVDPHQRLQLAYGIVVMSMAWTDYLCRYIPHPPLEWVHPAFFFTTVVMALSLGPRLLYLVFKDRRGGQLRKAHA